MDNGDGVRGDGGQRAVISALLAQESYRKDAGSHPEHLHQWPRGFALLPTVPPSTPLPTSPIQQGITTHTKIPAHRSFAPAR